MFSENITDYERLLEVIEALETLGAYYIVDKQKEKGFFKGESRPVWIVMQVA